LPFHVSRRKPACTMQAPKLWAFASVILAVSCKSPHPEPGAEPASERAQEGASDASKSPEKAPDTQAAAPISTAAAATGAATAPPPAATSPTVPGSDPLDGKFSLAEATAGLAGAGKLYAELFTDLGKLHCELFEDKAPITVANFVGLARGLRPWKAREGGWVKRPLYDGTVFHRVIRGFMIQGGDPLGTGAGDPGFVIPDEVWPGASHDKRGLLCMANRGKNTNGSQFFILDAPARHLDGGYTIFGHCGPDAVIDALASVPVAGDRSQKPTKLKKVTISRGKPKP
jgi:peptidyl-prolyl cis-trans isomerase A (cyclophilin A)